MDRHHVITSLVDGDATYQNMKTVLEDHVRTVRSDGDRIVWMYSGHGTDLPDIDGDEGQGGRDQALVPVDALDTGKFLIDDEIRAILADLAPGVGFTAILDCCYSGTSTRFLSRIPTYPIPPSKDSRLANFAEIGSKIKRQRWLPANSEAIGLHREFRLTQMDRQGRATQRGKARTAATHRWVALGACEEWEVAFETHGEGGDFTTRALRVLNRHGHTLSVGGFHKELLREFGPDRAQTPKVDATSGEMKRVLFGLRRTGLA